MSMKLPLSLVLLVILPYQRADAATPEARTVRPSPTQKTPRSERASTIRASDCYLRVDGVVRLDNRCDVYPMGDGGFTLNSWDRGKPRKSHFAVVSVTAVGKADVTWNANPNDDRAMDPLGAVTIKNGCWENTRVRICARKLQRKR